LGGIEIEREGGRKLGRKGLRYEQERNEAAQAASPPARGDHKHIEKILAYVIETFVLMNRLHEFRLLLSEHIGISWFHSNVR
jgi:hypothetical protein